MLDALSGLLAQVETYAKAHQFTIQALSMAGTLFAVLASIGIAWSGARSNRTRLRASAVIVRVFGGGVDHGNPPRYLVVDVTNVGNVPAWIDWGFFNWRVPFSGEYGQVNPLDAYPIAIPGTATVPAVVRYPTEIPPRASRRFRLSTLEVFKDQMLKDYERHDRFRKLCFRFQYAVVFTSDQRRFKVKLTKTVRKAMREIIMHLDQSGA